MTNGTGRVGSAQHTTLKTLSVEVKTLLVGQQQMTLSMYRQLSYGGLFDEVTGEMRGEPLGYVNVHNADCSMNEHIGYFPHSHLHVVWISDDHLRVDIVEPHPRSWGGGAEKARYALALLWTIKALENEQWFPDGLWVQNQGIRATIELPLVSSPGDAGAAATVALFHSAQFGITKEETLLEHLLLARMRVREGRQDRVDPYYAAQLTEWLATRPELADAPREDWERLATEQLEARIHRINALRRKWTANWKLVKALPQLFIAV